MKIDRKKQGESIKLPAELQEELRREIFPYMARGEKPPTRGELLLRAWRAFKSIPKSDDSGVINKSRQTGVASEEGPKVNSGVADFAVTRDEKPWVEKFLKVLRSRKPGLPIAAQNNMEEFAWADEAWSELERQQSPLVSSIGAGASERRRTPAEFPAVAGHRVNRSGDTEPESHIIERVRKIEERQDEGQKRKANAPRKTGQGR